MIEKDDFEVEDEYDEEDNEEDEEVEEPNRRRYNQITVLWRKSISGHNIQFGVDRYSYVLKTDKRYTYHITLADAIKSLRDYLVLLHLVESDSEFKTLKALIEEIRRYDNQIKMEIEEVYGLER